MMDKQGTADLPCTYCDKPAIPGTNPPVCELHLSKQAKAQLKKMASQVKPATLKELDAQ